MDHLPMFNNGQFDVVIHPVSTCYVPDVIRVYREVARVTKPGGLYISQHKQPASLQAPDAPSGDSYELKLPYYGSGPLPEVRGTRLREEGTLEFLHRWEQLLGGMCRNGFVIEDVVEPDHGDPQAERGSFAHRARYLPPYVRIKARRRQQPSSQGPSTLWVPL
jgi:SAM-dependent methyltransferase